MMAYCRLVTLLRKVENSFNLTAAIEREDLQFLEMPLAESRVEANRLIMQELEVLSLYKEILLIQIEHQESKTTLQHDLELIQNLDTHFQLKFVVIYRAERKKILHSQLYLIDMVIGFVEVLLNAGWNDFDNFFKSMIMEA